MTLSKLTPLELAIIEHFRTLKGDQFRCYLSADGERVLETTVSREVDGPLSPKMKALLESGQKIRLIQKGNPEYGFSGANWTMLAEHVGVLEMVLITGFSMFRGRVDYEEQVPELLQAINKIPAGYAEMKRMILPVLIMPSEPELLRDAHNLIIPFISQRFYELGLVDYESDFQRFELGTLLGIQQQPIRPLWSDILREMWP